MLSIRPLKIEGAYILEGEFFHDSRGMFRELMKFSDLKSIKCLLPWVQNNVSISNRNTIRGIHYSTGPVKQNKLVTCLNGSVRDFVVDVRRNSPTFGNFCEVQLNSSIPNSLFIEGGLGHAFLAQTDNCIVSYLLSSEYNPKNEFGLDPFDLDININWDVTDFLISDKDVDSESLKEALLNRRLPNFSFS